MVRYFPVIVLLALFIYGLIDCVRSEPADVRSIPKPAWVLVILLLPLLGVLLWFFLGRPRYSPQPGTYRRQPIAPDDDPDFLRNLETARWRQAQVDRLRKLKEAREAGAGGARNTGPAAAKPSEDGPQPGGRDRQDNPDTKP
ncbi:PLDc N-terminal domain-containing protein [Paenarthrobacter sp. Z7-10]|uniref:PLDc N-terminal domain-containing protein n=1 Tax=Paenarthrobacter sp. Z7-10 TaxID=2787635 RepID=UPI0022A9DCC4|nr:PLDc N-terminal domain-containing protein [Paenarthrobacter sp. Z7-10]MCZ2401764.1 PLDc N-terminal domain-containing protein [Paenarthrobacter sp. Z7-10]